MGRTVRVLRVPRRRAAGVVEVRSGGNGNGNAARGLGAVLRLPVRHGVPRRVPVGGAAARAARREARAMLRPARGHQGAAAARAEARLQSTRAATRTAGTEARRRRRRATRASPKASPRHPLRGKKTDVAKETPEALKAQLQDLLCEECPFCGEASIASIDAPFVRPDEAEEAESWRTPLESWHAVVFFFGAKAVRILFFFHPRVFLVSFCAVDFPPNANERLPTRI